MRAFKAWDSKGADFSTVVFAVTASQARAIAFHSETCEDSAYTDIRVRRLPEMDGHDRGRKEISWYDPEDRKALVSIGWSCYETSRECDTCECRSECSQWEDEKKEESNGKKPWTDGDGEGDGDL